MNPHRRGSDTETAEGAYTSEDCESTASSQFYYRRGGDHQEYYDHLKYKTAALSGAPCDNQHLFGMSYNNFLDDQISHNIYLLQTTDPFAMARALAGLNTAEFTPQQRTTARVVLGCCRTQNHNFNFHHRPMITILMTWIPPMLTL